MATKDEGLCPAPEVNVVSATREERRDGVPDQEAVLTRIRERTARTGTRLSVASILRDRDADRR